MKSNNSSYQKLQEEGKADVILVLHVCAAVLLCFPLVTNILSSVVLCKPRIRNTFAFFATQLMVLTIAEILYCLSFQINNIISVIYLFTSRRSRSVLFTSTIFEVVNWTLLVLINWTAALICAFQCKAAPASVRARLCFFGLLAIFAAIALALSSCLLFSAMYRGVIVSSWLFYVCLVVPPFLITLISAGCLCFKMRKSSGQRTAQNKTALTLAVLFSLFDFGFIPIIVVESLAMRSAVSQSSAVYLFIWHGEIVIITSSFLVFIFSASSKIFRMEAIACLKYKQGTDSDITSTTDV